MDSSYIVCSLDREKRAFIAQFELSIPLHDYDLKAKCVIDTGCSTSMFSLRGRSVNMGESYALQLKKEAIRANLRTHIAFGVNIPDEYIKKQIALYNSGNLLECDVVMFMHSIENFRVMGYPMGISTLGISYNNKSALLLGMDVLKYFDFHCGVSLVDDSYYGVSEGDYILVGCRRDAITKEYLGALCKYFGFPSSKDIWKYASGTIKEIAASFHVLYSKK